jgi:hypothetical protein
MKFEITRMVEHKETVEVDLPFYYKHDLMLDEADVVIYGKVEEKQCTTIKISHRYSNLSNEFELSIENRPASAYGCYITDEYKSNEVEFLAAKTKLLAAVRPL